MSEKGLFKKAAQHMLKLGRQVQEHEKRAKAVELIYKQAELGCGEIPRTHSELQEKIASMINQDLRVVEKALELTGGNLNLGELDTQDYSNFGGNASEKFQASIIQDF